MQSRLGNWKDGTPVKLRYLVISCKDIHTGECCEDCFSLGRDYWGPRQWNMHNLCVRPVCCRMLHHLIHLDEIGWKLIADAVGFDYSPYSFNRTTSYPITPVYTGTFTGFQPAQTVKKAVKIKRCKMCKEDDAEIGNYCEACHSFRQRNGLPI